MGTEVKIMKAIFVITIVFACSVVEITSLECYQCIQDDETVPNCASEWKVTCRNERKFCGKAEYSSFFAWFFNSYPPGHYIMKGCFEECTENGYLLFWGTWITCCQGDFCNA